MAQKHEGLLVEEARRLEEEPVDVVEVAFPVVNLREVIGRSAERGIVAHQLTRIGHSWKHFGRIVVVERFQLYLGGATTVQGALASQHVAFHESLVAAA